VDDCRTDRNLTSVSCHCRREGDRVISRAKKNAL
jgi:hypothetical protein